MKRQKFLQRLRKLIKKYGSENVVYFDESGFVSHMSRLSGWALRGKEWLAPFVFTGSCMSETVNAWLEKFLLIELEKPSIVIMDNAPVHNKKVIRSMLKKHGHALLPLPPYSPDFNPIEQSFGGMKKRREAMPIETTVEDLIISYS